MPANEGGQGTPKTALSSPPPALCPGFCCVSNALSCCHEPVQLPPSARTGVYEPQTRTQGLVCTLAIGQNPRIAVKMGNAELEGRTCVVRLKRPNDTGPRWHHHHHHHCCHHSAHRHTIPTPNLDPSAWNFTIRDPFFPMLPCIHGCFQQMTIKAHPKCRALG